jgi:hypothetical protein
MRHTRDPFFEELQELSFFLPSADSVRASNRTFRFLAAIFITGNLTLNRQKVVPNNAKRPPGNRAASSLGRIVPTEAKPSELSGEILSLAK